MKQEKISFKDEIIPIFKDHDELDSFFCVSISDTEQGVFYVGSISTIDVANATIQWLTIATSEQEHAEKGLILDNAKAAKAQIILKEALKKLNDLCEPYKAFKD